MNFARAAFSGGIFAREAERPRTSRGFAVSKRNPAEQALDVEDAIEAAAEFFTLDEVAMEIADGVETRFDFGAVEGWA